MVTARREADIRTTIPRRGGAKHRFAVLRRGLRMVNTAWAGTQLVSASAMDSRSFKCDTFSTSQPRAMDSLSRTSRKSTFFFTRGERRGGFTSEWRAAILEEEGLFFSILIPTSFFLIIFKRS